MAKRDDLDTPEFTGSSQYILYMLIFLGALGGIAWFIEQQAPGLFRDYFMANPAINGMILGVFALGVLFALRGAFQVSPSASWIRRYAHSTHIDDLPNPPALIAPLASLLVQREGPGRISSTSLSTMLDSVATRIAESGEITRYIIRLLIFLGLFGTFWGLLATVGAVSNVVEGLQTSGNATSGEETFANLLSAIKEPLSGMATAFASSLFGLGGSLIVGFLELQSNRAENRFFNELEEWLSRQAQVSTAITPGPRGSVNGVDVANAAMAELNQGITRLESALNRSVEMQVRADETVEKMARELSETNVRLRDQINKMGQMSGSGLDDRNIQKMQSTMDRIVQEQSAGRREFFDFIRAELKLLTKNLLGGK